MKVVVAACMLTFVAVVNSISPPVISISSLFKSKDSLSDSDLVARKKCFMEIDEAFREFGVFIAIDHPFEAEYQHALDHGRELFRASLEDKMAVSVESLGGVGRGYLPFGVESGVNSFFEPKEGFSYGFPHDETTVADHPLQRPNTYPITTTAATISSLESTFHATVNVAKVIVDAIQEAITLVNAGEGEVVDVDVDVHSKSNQSQLHKSFESHHQGSRQLYTEASKDGESISIMRLFHYFPAPLPLCLPLSLLRHLLYLCLQL